MITGGGTGGHVLPALAIATALVERGHDPASIVLVGSRRGLDASLAGMEGFERVLLPGRGIVRRASLSNVTAAAGMASALGRSLVLLRRRRPSVVVSVGGYAGFPCALAAVVERVPLVLANVEAAPGAAHRLLARFALAAAVAFDGSPLPRAVVTGTPVRPAMGRLDRSPAGRLAARGALGLPPAGPVLAVVGGSLGSRRINHAVAAMARQWEVAEETGGHPLGIHHVVGRRDWVDPPARGPEARRPGLWYHAVEYEERMAELLTAADLFVGRSGLNTVAELTVAGVPSILIPLPRAPRDHQSANAAALAREGAAVVLADEDCTPAKLSRLVKELLADPVRLEKMAAAAASLGRPDAAGNVAALADLHARRRR